MPFSAVGTYVCRALQQVYVDYFGNNSPEFKTMGSTALIKYLLSPQNTRGFKQINVESIPGKKRPVAFLVDNPFCFDVTSPAVNCNTARGVIANASQEMVFDLSANAFRVTDAEGDPLILEFAEDDLMKYCTETDQSYVQRQILRYLRRFEEALDKALFAILNTNVGTNAAGAATTSLPFFTLNTTTNTSAINSDSIWFMDQAYQNIGGEGQYGLIGGQVINKINTFMKWAGLNQAGVDLSKLGDTNPYSYYDRNADSVLGANTFLQMSPGSAQLVIWNRFKGEKKRSVTDLYTHDTIISPMTGLPIDYEWTFDYKCKVWRFEAFLHAELAVNRPGGCGIATSNGIIKYIDCSNSIEAPACPEVEP